MTPLPSNLKAMRARVFKHYGGVCHICRGKILAGEAWDAEHVIPRQLGGDHSLENVRPAHRKCHRGPGSKTSDDVAKIAKAKRLNDKHRGIARPAGLIPGSKGSRFKRKVNGEVVER